MKLIFIYGPPAVGKLTVAQELAKLTGYKILDIHLVSDVTVRFFDRYTPPHSKLNRAIRLQIIETCAQENLPGIIFTYGYSMQSADEFIKNLIALIEKYHGTIHFVRLVCSMDQLLKRVESAERKGTHKLSDPQALIRTLQERDWLRQIPFVENLVIDTTILRAQDVAEKIKKEC